MLQLTPYYSTFPQKKFLTSNETGVLGLWAVGETTAAQNATCDTKIKNLSKTHS